MIEAFDSAGPPCATAETRVSKTKCPRGSRSLNATKQVTPFADGFTFRLNIYLWLTQHHGFARRRAGDLEIFCIFRLTLPRVSLSNATMVTDKIMITQ